MSHLPPSIIRQTGDAVEGRVVSQAAMLLDVPVTRTDIEGLKALREDLRAGSLPVGSVEFVRQALAVAGVPEPAPMSYPPELESLLRRHVHQRDAGSVIGTWFVKPTETKLFTGFVFDTLRAREDYPVHVRADVDAFMALPPSTPVWVSELAAFQCEWRYYVLDGQVLGSARYDEDGADDAPEPEMAVVLEAVRLMSGRPVGAVSYGLDVGVLAGGETALVEVNDAWALGYYSRCMAPRDYLGLLTARWRQMAGAALEVGSTPRQVSRARPT